MNPPARLTTNVPSGQAWDSWSPKAHHCIHRSVRKRIGVLAPADPNH
jgi:hypothetical protein